MNNLPQKKHRALLWKKYFTGDFKLVKVKKSLWDALPEDCKAVVFEKRGLNKCAAKIQLHYRKVRYAPGTAPEFKFPDRVRIDANNIITVSQRVVINWHPASGKTWAPGTVATGKCDLVSGPNAGTPFKYDANILYVRDTPIEDMTDMDYIYAYWYDPKNLDDKYSSDPEMIRVRNRHMIKNCVLIKPW